MNKNHLNLIIEELRRSRQVYNGPAQAFAKWLVNYFIPQLQAANPDFSEQQATGLIAAVV